jgi:hypothetical protein
MYVLVFCTSDNLFFFQLAEFPVQFLLPGGQTVVLTCSAHVTLADIKEQLRVTAGAARGTGSHQFVLDH